jgi:hypothetical protein
MKMRTDWYLKLYQIKVITKLPNSEQSYKGKVKTHNYIKIQSDIIWDIIPKLNRGRQKRILIIKSPTVKIDCVVKSPGVMLMGFRYLGRY